MVWGILWGMRPPVYVRSLTDAERTRLEDGLRLSDAFVLRRCQVLLASARHERPPQIAQALGCDDQTVRSVIRRLERDGIDACLTRQSNRPRHPALKIDAAAAQELRALLHQSPRSFGKPTGIWTLAMAAEVSFAEGVIPERVSGEAIRLALKRLGIGWKRAKRWITSPDPEYARKKRARPFDPLGREPSRLGSGLRGRDLVESSVPTRAAHLCKRRLSSRPLAGIRVGQFRPMPLG